MNFDFEDKFSADEIFKYHKESGKIALSTQRRAKFECKIGVKYLDLAEKIENYILELGGQLAFPANLSRNNEAAHYTPSIGDERLIEEKDVVKIDLGVHVNGFITDCAFTLDLSEENEKLVNASRKALQNAIDAVKPGVLNRQLGRIIQDSIVSQGFKPISNLCGHAVKRFNLHAGVNIPNVESGSYVLKEGDVFAIEPFATNGRGTVKDSSSIAHIFSVTGALKARTLNARSVAQVITSNFLRLPFALRHVAKKMKAPSFQLSEYALESSIEELVKNKGLHAYCVLVEAQGSQVSQAETTLIVTKDGCEPFAPIME